MLRIHPGGHPAGPIDRQVLSRRRGTESASASPDAQTVVDAGVGERRTGQRAHHAIGAIAGGSEPAPVAADRPEAQVARRARVLVARARAARRRRARRRAERVSVRTDGACTRTADRGRCQRIALGAGIPVGVQLGTGGARPRRRRHDEDEEEKPLASASDHRGRHPWGVQHNPLAVES
jgi:hypothetical protein